ncbi:eukaryotic translation initiation factor 4 gamma [Anaeramoeba flamelloides]|uniref:Eukaryotic translation initiation factor 4 gamma n=1 Tax=Anaeramoeba flamelloides TaxID=1746091 RepID=A0ABQ8XMK6_9EUKA|nr:eukaryotic translation initiation factor 4 gamma [Anaeramoeba flamelloides]
MLKQFAENNREHLKEEIDLQVVSNKQGEVIFKCNSDKVDRLCVISNKLFSIINPVYCNKPIRIAGGNHKFQIFADDCDSKELFNNQEIYIEMGSMNLMCQGYSTIIICTWDCEGCLFDNFQIEIKDFLKQETLMVKNNAKSPYIFDDLQNNQQYQIKVTGYGLGPLETSATFTTQTTTIFSEPDISLVRIPNIFEIEKDSYPLVASQPANIKIFTSIIEKIHPCGELFVQLSSPKDISVYIPKLLRENIFWNDLPTYNQLNFWGDYQTVKDTLSKMRVFYSLQSGYQKVRVNSNIVDPFSPIAPSTIIKNLKLKNVNDINKDPKDGQTELSTKLEIQIQNRKFYIFYSNNIPTFETDFDTNEDYLINTEHEDNDNSNEDKNIADNNNNDNDNNNNNNNNNNDNGNDNIDEDGIYINTHTKFSKKWDDILPFVDGIVIQPIVLKDETVLVKFGRFTKEEYFKTCEYKGEWFSNPNQQTFDYNLITIDAVLHSARFSGKMVIIEIGKNFCIDEEISLRMIQQYIVQSQIDQNQISWRIFNEKSEDNYKQIDYKSLLGNNFIKNYPKKILNFDEFCDDYLNNDDSKIITFKAHDFNQRNPLILHKSKCQQKFNRQNFHKNGGLLFAIQDTPKLKKDDLQQLLLLEIDGIITPDPHSIINYLLEIVQYRSFHQYNSIKIQTVVENDKSFDPLTNKVPPFENIYISNQFNNWRYSNLKNAFSRFNSDHIKKEIDSNFYKNLDEIFSLKKYLIYKLDEQFDNEDYFDNINKNENLEIVTETKTESESETEIKTEIEIEIESESESESESETEIEPGREIETEREDIEDITKYKDELRTHEEADEKDIIKEGVDEGDAIEEETDEKLINKVDDELAKKTQENETNDEKEKNDMKKEAEENTKRNDKKEVFEDTEDDTETKDEFIEKEIDELSESITDIDTEDEAVKDELNIKKDEDLENNITFDNDLKEEDIENKKTPYTENEDKDDEKKNIYLDYEDSTNNPNTNKEETITEDDEIIKTDTDMEDEFIEDAIKNINNKRENVEDFETDELTETQNNIYDKNDQDTFTRDIEKEQEINFDDFEKIKINDQKKFKNQKKSKKSLLLLLLTLVVFVSCIKIFRKKKKTHIKTSYRKIL